MYAYRRASCMGIGCRHVHLCVSASVFVLVCVRVLVCARVCAIKFRITVYKHAGINANTHARASLRIHTQNHTHACVKAHSVRVYLCLCMYAIPIRLVGALRGVCVCMCVCMCTF